jgi:hypothetical protein
MPRAILRFIGAPSGYETSHSQIVYENYGVAMYYAQLIEGKLCLMMAGLEVLGLVHIDREAYKLTVASDGIIEACIGQMLYILREHSRFDIPPDLIKHLRKANMQRNMLAHRFFILHARDLVTESGCVRVARKLLPIYEHLVRVDHMLDHLNRFIFQRCGGSPERMDEKARRLLRELRESEDDKTT